ncbi:hypothetical protein M6B38_109435 [Iris pallida]|uniref:Uncharacterized protein n=1 Tax=Iris pallida TaxID=29817 RepID=A0AAX6E8U5_IRIPA|nr:hypothetical protein M6B38_109435 [Iris pallida]
MNFSIHLSLFCEKEDREQNRIIECPYIYRECRHKFSSFIVRFTINLI